MHCSRLTSSISLPYLTNSSSSSRSPLIHRSVTSQSRKKKLLHQAAEASLSLNASLFFRDDGQTRPDWTTSSNVPYPSLLYLPYLLICSVPSNQPFLGTWHSRTKGVGVPSQMAFLVSIMTCPRSSSWKLRAARVGFSLVSVAELSDEEGREETSRLSRPSSSSSLSSSSSGNSGDVSVRGVEMSIRSSVWALELSTYKV